MAKTAFSPRSSLPAAKVVSIGDTSAPQRQKFHTDDVNQCLHSKSCGHGVLNVIFFGQLWLNFVFFWERAPANHKCFFERYIREIINHRLFSLCAELLLILAAYSFSSLKRLTSQATGLPPLGTWPKEVHKLERATSMSSCHGVLTDKYIFRTILVRV